MEASSTPFPGSAATRTLSLQFTPTRAMQMLVHIREALCQDASCTLPVSRDPVAETEATDQQGYRAYTLVINVTGGGGLTDDPPSVTLSSPDNGGVVSGTVDMAATRRPTTWV